MAIHEICHVLGFSKNLYRHFIDEHGQRRRNVIVHGEYRGVNGMMITTPKVKEIARKYYRCNDI